MAVNIESEVAKIVNQVKHNRAAHCNWDFALNGHVSDADKETIIKRVREIGYRVQYKGVVTKGGTLYDRYLVMH